MAVTESDTFTSAAPAPAPADGPVARRELGSFLRTRRERLTPADVGLAPGLRRRTPGLRREEVAQLAGIGVTWYTWLEQGRPINASIQVLDAVARTLRLDGAERAHLRRLASVPAPADPEMGGGSELEPEIQVILDGLSALPGAAYNARMDLLAWNASFAGLFPGLVATPVGRRNALWHVFAAPECRCCRFVNFATEAPRMVAMLRGDHARHMGDPVWGTFVDDLAAASPEFARLWAGHDVAQPDTRHKTFHHLGVGDVHLVTTTLMVARSGDHRLVVYVPADGVSRDRVAWLTAHPDRVTCAVDAVDVDAVLDIAPAVTPASGRPGG